MIIRSVRLTPTKMVGEMFPGNVFCTEEFSTGEVLYFVVMDLDRSSIFIEIEDGQTACVNLKDGTCIAFDSTVKVHVPNCELHVGK